MAGTATKKESKAKQNQNAAASLRQQKQNRLENAVKYIVAIAVIVVLIGVAIFTSVLLNPGNNKSMNGSFLQFRHNFDTAPRVNLFVTAYNGTVLSSTEACATSVIEQVVSNRTYHRNSSTIDFNLVVNSTSCIRVAGLPGGASKPNYTTTSLQNCLNTTKAEPTLYINYSITNRTEISPEYMYVSGDALFLSECGIASQIS